MNSEIEILVTVYKQGIVTLTLSSTTTHLRCRCLLRFLLRRLGRARRRRSRLLLAAHLQHALATLRLRSLIAAELGAHPLPPGLGVARFPTSTIFDIVALEPVVADAGERPVPAHVLAPEARHVDTVPRPDGAGQGESAWTSMMSSKNFYNFT